MKKIMFSDGFMLTQAVLDGRKMQTRRIISRKTLDKIKLFQEEYYDLTFDKLEDVELLAHYFFTEKRGKLPYNVGEVVAVAQSYKTIYNEEGLETMDMLIQGLKNSKGWNNKMFVRSSDMSHQIRINDVRVERLQDISEEDAIAEGITYAGLFYEDYGEPMFIIEGYKQAFGSAKDAYAWLIDKISGKGTWERNPYVFVYDFELVK